MGYEMTGTTYDKSTVRHVEKENINGDNGGISVEIV